MGKKHFGKKEKAWRSIRFSFICVFAVLINKVSLQETVTVEAVIGGSVVLPCSSTERALKLQDIDVHWRHNGSKIVYDIVKGQDSLEKQDPQYKNRAETFPDEPLRGNFSIKINHLTHDDAGEFSCLISHSSEHQTIQLIINAEKGSKSTYQGNRGEETGANVETSSSLTLVYIVLPVVVVLVLIACFIIFLLRGRIRSALLPSEEQRPEIEMINRV